VISRSVANQGAISYKKIQFLGRPFVKWFALCYRTVVCPVLSCLSVTLVYCGQTVGRIKMKLGKQVGLPQKGAEPLIVGPCLLLSKGCMDQDATWYGDRPRPGHIVLDGDPAPLPKKGTQPPNFRSMSTVPKRLNGSRWHIVWRWASIQVTLR